MKVTSELSASLEDYLEAIYHIVEEKQAAKGKDIADRLHVRRPSVTGALRSLAERGLVNYAPYDIITLTPEGRAAAEGVVKRHVTLQDFLVKVLSIPPVEAEETACRIEHAISEPVLERFVDFIEFVERCPRGGAVWVEGRGYRCPAAAERLECEPCVEERVASRDESGDLDEEQ